MFLSLLGTGKDIERHGGRRCMLWICFLEPPGDPMLQESD